MNETDQLPQMLSPEEIARSQEIYANWRNYNDGAIKIGIFDEDLERAFQNPNTTFLKETTEDGESLSFPMLVPMEDLEWYNADLIKKNYGEDARALCYVHPPIQSEESKAETLEILKDKLDQGYVIVADKYGDDTSSPIAQVIEEAQQGAYSIDAFGGDDESRVDIFVGPVAVNGGAGVSEAPSIYDVYQAAVERGELVQSPTDGVAVEASIEGEEAEAIWNIYENPFHELGAEDPVHAGFDKDTLLEILKDPEVTKITNRVDGEITTLCFFLHSFDKAPWFNKEYYQKNYPEYFNTGNIMMFPGIVSDENKRGNKYAMGVINFATDLLAKRGSDALVTFECTEVSSTYIPAIVEASINQSEVAQINNIDQPVGQINYFALKKN